MTLRSNREPAGFTLIEMIVVIAVLGLILAMLSANGPPHSRWLQTVAAGNQLAASMHAAQTRALTTGAPVIWAPPPLPAWLGVAAKIPPGGLIFEPDGSATGGTLVLSAVGRYVIVQADWLTGRITVSNGNIGRDS